MDRGAWQATVHGVTKSLDTTEWLTLSFHTYTLSPLYMNEFQEHIHKSNLLSSTVSQGPQLTQSAT